MYRLILASLLVVISPSLYAEDWKFLLNDENGKPIMVDYNSIKSERDLIFFDIRYTPNSRFNGLFSDVAYNRESIVVACEKQSYAVVTEIDELKNGMLKIKSSRPLPSLEYISPSKYSEPYKVIQALCTPPSSKASAINQNSSKDPKSVIKSKIISGSPVDYNWRFTGNGAKDRQNLYINTPSIQRISKSIVSIITKSEFDSDIKTLSGTPYRYSVVQVYIDCDNETAVTSMIDFYSSNHNLQETYYQEFSELKEEKIPPNSLIDLVKNTACPIGMALEINGTKASEKQVNKQSQMSVGTGWLIAPNYLVTASHVIDGADQIQVVLSESDVIEARIVANDTNNDIAIIKISKPLKSTPLLIANKQPRLGSKVAVLGYPLVDVLGLKIQATTGEVSGLRGFQDDQRFYQISAPVQSGNSGGPLLNQEGEVIGVISSKLNDVEMLKTSGQVPQNVNFALKYPYVQALIESAGIETKSKFKKALNLEDAINLVKNSVYLILVSTSPK